MDPFLKSMTDDALVREYCDRKNNRAFDELVARYFERVYSVCKRKLDNEADAEDATNVTFFRASKSLCQSRPRKFEAWLRQIAHNVCNDILKDGQRQQRSIEDTTSSFEEAVLNKDCIEKALKQLPEDCQRLCFLTYGLRLKAAEIAKVEGKRRDEVGQDLAKARQALRKAFAEICPEEAASLAADVIRSHLSKLETVLPGATVAEKVTECVTAIKRSMKIKGSSEALRYLRKELANECDRIRNLRDIAERKGFDRLKTALDELLTNLCKESTSTEQRNHE